MIRARHVSLAFAVVLLVALTVGTGGFSSMTADRGVTISVAEDPNAYLGIVMGDASGTNGDETTLLQLTNQFGTYLDTVGVDIMDEGSVDVTIVSTPDDLSTGEQGHVKATIECDEESSDDIALRISASGPDVEIVRVDKTVTVECSREDATTANGTENVSGETTTSNATNTINETMFAPTPSAFPPYDGQRLL